MNAYLVVIDEDGEKTFVAFCGTADGAAKLGAMNVGDPAESITVSLLCDGEHVLGLANINNERDKT